jgi:membrane-associated phospholipid phosphatase
MRMKNTLKTVCPQNRLLAIALVWLGLTALAVPLDAWVHDFFAGQFGQSVLKPCLTFLDFLGGYSVHVLCFTIVMASVPKAKTAARYLAMMLGSTILYSIVKVVVGRVRPGAHMGPFVFHHFASQAKGAGSFPSGQATSGMALATLLGLYFPKGKWWFWSMACVTAMGRVVELRHFLSDAVFGAGLGLLFVLAVDSLIPDRSECPAETVERQ